MNSGNIPIFEFCYQQDKVIKIIYTCQDGEDAERLKKDIDILQTKWGSNCPFYWRIKMS